MDFKKVEIDNTKWARYKLEFWLLMVITIIFSLVIVGGIINLTYNNENNIANVEGLIKTVNENGNQCYITLHDNTHRFVYRRNSGIDNLNQKLAVDTKITLYVLSDTLESSNRDIEIYGITIESAVVVDYQQSLKEHQRSFFLFMAFFLPLITICIIRMCFISRRLKGLKSKEIKDSIEDLLEHQRNTLLYRYMSINQRWTLFLKGRNKLFIPILYLSIVIIVCSVIVLIIAPTESSVHIAQLLLSLTGLSLICYSIFIDRNPRFNNVKAFCNNYQAYLNSTEYEYYNKKMQKKNPAAYEMIKKRYINLKNQMIVDFHHQKMVCQYIDRIKDGIAFFEIDIKDLNLSIKTRYDNSVIPCCFYLCSDIKNNDEITNDVVLILNNRLYQWIKENNIHVEGLDEALENMEENIKNTKIRLLSSSFKGVIK